MDDDGKTGNEGRGMNRIRVLVSRLALTSSVDRHESKPLKRLRLGASRSTGSWQGREGKKIEMMKDSRCVVANAVRHTAIIVGGINELRP